MIMLTQVFGWDLTDYLNHQIEKNKLRYRIA